MFTAARICLALSTTCTGVLAFSGANAIPLWARLTIGAVGLFTGAIVGFSGPVSKSAGEL